MPLLPLREALEGWTPGRAGALDPLHAICAAWPAIVGPAVAAHCAPTEISGTALVIATRSSAWSQQLQMLSVAILGGLAAVPAARKIERLTFRSGLLRRTAARNAGAIRTQALRRGSVEPPPEPASDVTEALERLRRRISEMKRSNRWACSSCGAPLETAASKTCAPCAGTAERERTLQLERIVYLAPWLSFEELREQLPSLGAGEFERARRHLLQRWWLLLERAKRAGKLSTSGLERHVASSYVLLQSRLAPDRITPAVVRNLLGPELDALLWPAAPDKAHTSDLSNKRTR
jgi:hypothetical protein